MNPLAVAGQSRPGSRGAKHSSRILAVRRKQVTRSVPSTFWGPYPPAKFNLPTTTCSKLGH